MNILIKIKNSRTFVCCFRFEINIIIKTVNFYSETINNLLCSCSNDDFRKKKLYFNIEI